MGLQIQIAHFEPTVINIMGEGVFPRLSLDLPRYTDNDEYVTNLHKEAKDNLEREASKHPDQSIMSTPPKRKEDEESAFHGMDVSI